MKIFSSVWLHYENCCRKYFHVFGSILKMLFSGNISHGNSTHGSKLRQSKATTTKTPPPHHHNNNKNQNQRERESGGSKARSKARLSGAVRSDQCDQCDRHGAITIAIDAVRSGACNRRTRAREIERGGAIGAVLRSTRPVRLVRAIVGLELRVRQ